MSAIDVAGLADKFAAHIRGLDRELRKAAKKNPYMVTGVATAAGIALVSGFLPALIRLVPAAARVVPAVMKVAGSGPGRALISALSGAALAKKLERA